MLWKLLAMRDLGILPLKMLLRRLRSKSVGRGRLWLMCYRLSRLLFSPTLVDCERGT